MRRRADAAAAVALLLDHGMDADAVNATGNTALHAAVRRGGGGRESTAALLRELITRP